MTGDKYKATYRYHVIRTGTIRSAIIDKHLGQSMKPWKGKSEMPAKKRLEKSELSKIYKRQKQTHRDAWYADPTYGERITTLRDLLGRFGAEDAEQMWNAFLASLPWLKGAPDDLKFLAVALAAETQARIRREAGLVELDDPLPPDDNIYLRIRDLLR